MEKKLDIVSLNSIFMQSQTDSTKKWPGHGKES
jgi:hypothetical protein